MTQAGGQKSLPWVGFPDLLRSTQEEPVGLRFPPGHAFYTASHWEGHASLRHSPHSGQDTGGMVVGFDKQANRPVRGDLVQQCGEWAESSGHMGRTSWQARSLTAVTSQVSQWCVGQRWVPSSREGANSRALWDPGGPITYPTTPGVCPSQSRVPAPWVQLCPSHGGAAT